MASSISITINPITSTDFSGQDDETYTLRGDWCDVTVQMGMRNYYSDHTVMRATVPNTENEVVTAVNRGVSQALAMIADLAKHEPPAPDPAELRSKDEIVAPADPAELDFSDEAEV